MSAQAFWKRNFRNNGSRSLLGCKGKSFPWRCDQYWQLGEISGRRWYHKYIWRKFCQYFCVQRRFFAKNDYVGAIEILFLLKPNSPNPPFFCLSYGLVLPYLWTSYNQKVSAILQRWHSLQIQCNYVGASRLEHGNDYTLLWQLEYPESLVPESNDVTGENLTKAKATF